MTYFGSFARASAVWQPLRFRIALHLTMALAASYALASMAGQPWTRLVREWKAWLIAAGLVGAAVNGITTERSGPMRLETEFKLPATDVVRWLYTIVPRSGRVLFEESGDETHFVHSHMYLSAFLPHVSS